ncbi:hypothetical protein [Sinorhizobium fredii]|uniref:hypothetical protein n=1 Tax=Rhizobium fredii TaxID=380 RepID=UPI001297F726|nr:hypothetical protein [Sinorhizobium fredii]MQW94087.1 hypothetical protein [Sinorhizobium fredii]
MTQLQTAKMIYAQKNIAHMIASRLTKSKGVDHLVRQVTTGFQVVPITKCPDYVPPAKPLPVKKPEPIATGTTLPSDDYVVIDLKFRGESKAYVDAWTAEGKPISFGKTTLIGWEIQGDKVLLKMAKTVAQKRGFLAA